MTTMNKDELRELIRDAMHATDYAWDADGRDRKIRDEATETILAYLLEACESREIDGRTYLLVDITEPGPDNLVLFREAQ